MSQKEAELEVMKMELQELNLWFIEHGSDPKKKDQRLKKARRKYEIERSIPELKREVGQEKESGAIISDRAAVVFDLAELDPSDPIQLLRAAYTALRSFVRRCEPTREEQAVIDTLRGYF